MRNRVFAVAIAFLILLTHPSTSLGQVGQAPHDWSIVKTIPAGDELVVKLKNSRTRKGRLRIVSDTVLTLNGSKRNFDIERDEVQQIYRVVPKSAAKPTLMGAGIGAAIAGTGIAIAAAADDTGGTDGELAAAFIGISLLGAGAGALVGLIFGSRQKKVLIYQAR